MKNTKPTCEDVFKHLCDNLDRDMNSPQCRDIKSHMDACPDCVTYLNTLKKTIGMYKEYPIPRLTQASRKRLHSLLQIPQ